METLVQCPSPLLLESTVGNPLLSERDGNLFQGLKDPIANFNKSETHYSLKEMETLQHTTHAFLVLSIVGNPLLSERDGNVSIITIQQSFYNVSSETHYSLKEMETR